jgi:hypothetical protein
VQGIDLPPHRIRAVVRLGARISRHRKETDGAEERGDGC